MLSVNGTAVSMNMAADYTDYEVAVSVTKDSTIEIKNAHGSNSMNVKGIKVIASGGWATKLTSGADLTNIDAYEVDSRKEQVPATVKTKSGSHMYSNFDIELGDTGMGVTIAPTDPDQAKEDVIKYAGRHNSDFAYTFNNATDDKDYGVNNALKALVVNYKSGLTAVQGTTQGSGGSSGGNGGGDEGNKEEEKSPVTPPAPEGAVGALTFPSSTFAPTNAGIQFTVTKGGSEAGSKDFYTGNGKVKILKMESATKVSFTTPGTTSDVYTMTISYVATSNASLTLTPGSEITLSAGGNLGSSDSAGSVVSVTESLKGGTNYEISRESTESWIYSIVITEAE